MNSEFYVLVTWVRKEDMQLTKSVMQLSRDTELGQGYEYWGEDNIAKLYAERFHFDEEVVILATEEIEGIR